MTHMTYKCDNCGRTEDSTQGPLKCSCGLPDYIIIMRPALVEDTELNEYLTED